MLVILALVLNVTVLVLLTIVVTLQTRKISYLLDTQEEHSIKVEGLQEELYDAIK